MKDRLTYEQRCTIKALLEQGVSKTKIAEKIGVHNATIYREINRNSSPDGIYNPSEAQRKYKQRINDRPFRDNILMNYKLTHFIAQMIINEKISVPDICQMFPNAKFPDISFSRNTLYKAIDEGRIPGVTRETLHTNTVTFSDGLLYIPCWAKQRMNIADGDEFEIIVSEDNKSITFVKQ